MRAILPALRGTHVLFVPPASRTERRFSFLWALAVRHHHAGIETMVKTHASYRRQIPELTGSAWDIEAEADRRIDHAGLRLGPGGRPVGQMRTSRQRVTRR